VEERRDKHLERMMLGQGFLVCWGEVEITVVVTVVAGILLATLIMDIIMATTMAITMAKTMATIMAKIMATTMVKTMDTIMAKTMATTTGKIMVTTMAKTLDTIPSNQVVSAGMTSYFRTNMVTLTEHAEGLMRLEKPGAIVLDGAVTVGTCPDQESIQTTLGLIRHVALLANEAMNG